jgi:hypothetical protein
MIEEIIKYLDGELEGEALNSFEQRLRHDDSLKAEVDAVKASKKVSEGIIEAEIMGYIRNINSSKNTKEIKSSAPKKNVRFLYIIGAVAASALLFFFVNFNSKINDASSSRDVYTLYYTRPIWPGERGGDVQPLDIMIARYLDGQKDVINDLLSSDVTDKDHLEKRYWAAEILLKEKRYAEAAGIADDLIKSKVHVSRSHYIKVMYLLSSKPKGEVINYINSISKEDLEKDELKLFEELKK